MRKSTTFKKFIFFVINMKLQITMCLLISFFYVNECHIEELINKIKECSNCELKWEKHSSSVNKPSENSGICRAYGDRLIPGELQYDNTKKKSFCKIPFFKKALDKYDYELLKLNNHTVRTLYTDNVEGGHLFEKLHCTKDKIKELISDHHKKHHM